MQTAAAEYLSLAVLAVYLLSLIPATLVRWRLYRGGELTITLPKEDAAL